MAMINELEKMELINFANDSSTFAEIYNYYFPRVHNYVHYRVADFHAADDLTSHIFEKIIFRFSYYKSEKAPFSAWLFSIARNAITDHYRSQRRTNFTSIEITEELIDFEPRPEDVAEFNETRKYLINALKFLNEREQDIIDLKFWRGLSNREIARLVGISESNTGVILFRAMKKLKIILENHGVVTCD